MDLLAFWLPYTYKEGYLKLVNISSQCLGLRMTLILWSFSTIIYLNGKPGTYKLKAEPTVVQGKSGWKLPLDFRSFKKKEINIHWLDIHKLALQDDQIIWSAILNSLLFSGFHHCLKKSKINAKSRWNAYEMYKFMNFCNLTPKTGEKK